jgi:hypothetical protein
MRNGGGHGDGHAQTFHHRNYLCQAGSALGPSSEGVRGIAMSFDTTLITADWDLEKLREPVLRELHAYWNGQRAARPMPARADIDVVEIPALLPYVFLVDVLDQPPDFRFRLAGTHFSETTGQEVTGKRICEVFPEQFGGEVRIIWSKAVAERRPVLGRGNLWISGREYVKWEGMVLPLAADDHSINMLLGGIVFHPGGHA